MTRVQDRIGNSLPKRRTILAIVLAAMMIGLAGCGGPGADNNTTDNETGMDDNETDMDDNETDMDDNETNETGMDNETNATDNATNETNETGG
jgi:hypothetical protein